MISLKLGGGKNELALNYLKFPLTLLNFELGRSKKYLKLSPQTSLCPKTGSSNLVILLDHIAEIGLLK